MDLLASFLVLFILGLEQYPKNTEAVPIDNGVSGEPVVVCGADATELYFATQNMFRGKLFVKGHYKEAGCNLDLTNGEANTAPSIRIPFNGCGTANPRGVFVTTTVLIQFHPYFLTKVDRAYKVQCFYMEAEKTVQQQIDVSELTTIVIDRQAEMPVCSYSIHKDSPDGPEARFFQIGEKVVHKWKCEQPSGGDSPFGMLVHSCQVSDGRQQTIMLVDETGCSLDPYILNHLQYGPDLTLAVRPAHVFKFADHTELQFRCQIRLCHKALGSCQGMTPPKCAELVNRRKRRTITELDQRISATPIGYTTLTGTGGSEYDVQTNTLVVIEPNEIVVGNNRSLAFHDDPSSNDELSSDAGMCLPRSSLAVGVSLLVVWSVILILATVFCTWKRCFTGKFKVQKKTFHGLLN